MANPLIRIEAEEGFLFFYFLVNVIFFERIQIWPWLQHIAKAKCIVLIRHISEIVYGNA